MLKSETKRERKAKAIIGGTLTTIGIFLVYVLPDMLAAVFALLAITCLLIVLAWAFLCIIDDEEIC